MIALYSHVVKVNKTKKSVLNSRNRSSRATISHVLKTPKGFLVHRWSQKSQRLITTAVPNSIFLAG